MTSLFSSFSPVTLAPYLSLNWLSLGIIAFLPSSYWFIWSVSGKSLYELLMFFADELKLVLRFPSSSEKLMLISLFIFIVLNNFAGLLPYVFTATSHLSVSMSLGLILWMGYFFLSSSLVPSKTFAHLVPLGTPLVLAPFMTLIEIVSNLMRPLTLSIRLTANMVAGHLLLGLVTGPMGSMAWIMLFILLILTVLMMVLEWGVAFIQAYVFFTLSSLYLSEAQHPLLK